MTTQTPSVEVARCMHCGHRMIPEGGGWRHDPPQPDCGPGCPYRINPDNWR